MPLTVEQLAQEALLLPPACRAELAGKLMESIDLPGIDDLRVLWAKEVMRRGDDVRTGKVAAISGEEVLAEARRIAAG